jgi:hypothetical protein
VIRSAVTLTLYQTHHLTYDLSQYIVLKEMSDSGLSRHEESSGLSPTRRPRSASEAIRRRVNQLLGPLGSNVEEVEPFHMRHPCPKPEVKDSTTSRRMRHSRVENRSADSSLGIVLSFA